MVRNMDKVWAMADEVEALGCANIETDAQAERKADLAAEWLEVGSPELMAIFAKVRASWLE